MTAEQLEELLGKVTPGEWVDDDTHSLFSGRKLVCIVADEESNNYGGNFESGEAESNLILIALAPALARRVVAAEKLVERIDEILDYNRAPWYAVHEALTAYREASK